MYSICKSVWSNFITAIGFTVDFPRELIGVNWNLSFLTFPASTISLQEQQFTDAAGRKGHGRWGACKMHPKEAQSAATSQEGRARTGTEHRYIPIQDQCGMSSEQKIQKPID